ncbi:MAG: FtsX-like permease family protein [Alphaproteobacteria bacterium]
MTIAVTGIATPTQRSQDRTSLGAAVRLAFRDLRGGLRGFGIFLGCIALGVAAIAGVGSFARGLVDGLSREGRVILGADVSFQRVQQEADGAIRDYFASNGTLATIATTRSMVRNSAGLTSLVELKAVEPGTYPLFGQFDVEPAGNVRELLSAKRGADGALVDGVLVEAALLARLDLKIGDRLIIGDLSPEIRGIIRQEPDRLAGGVGFGPRLMISLEAFRRTNLIMPGSLVRWLYQIKLPENAASDAALRSFVSDVRGRFPEGGFDVRTRLNASPQLSEQVGRFSQFLTLVGLTALLVGGVGVANAVTRFVDRKRDDIATLKAIGAGGDTVFVMAAIEIGVIALVGIAIGLAVGLALPFLIVWGLGAFIPVPIAPGIYPQELALALGYGLLVAASFAIWPLGRAHDVPVAALFRDTVAPQRQLPRLRYILLTLLAIGALTGLAVAVAFNPRLSLMFLGMAAGVFIALRLVATGIMALARRAPRPRSLVLRMALANIHRPGALTPSVVLSLGLGLTLLVVIALVDASFQRQITSALPERAPAFFFVDIANSEAPRFDRFIAEKAPSATLDRVPMLRGRFVALGGRPVEEIRAADDMSWALRGDRGITYADAVPKNSRVTEGEWWPANYSGPPLVSFDERMGRGFGLKIGDPVTVNVLGRNMTATIANFRSIQWDNLGINFIVVFSPNTFRGAPHSHLATLTYPAVEPAATEIALLRDVAAAFPSVTTVRVKDALEAVGQLATQLATAIRAASGVTLAAAILVLAGALAAGHRSRVYDAVILKTLGAGRPTLIAVAVAEYAALGLVTAIFALGTGALAAWLVTTQVMRIGFVFSWEAAVLTTVMATMLTVCFGLIGTIRALGAKPAAVLRHL